MPPAPGTLLRLHTDASGAPTGMAYLPAPAIFSPDGTSIIFHRNGIEVLPDAPLYTMDVFLRNLDTFTLTQLDTAADGTQPDWAGTSGPSQFSPDGTKVLLHSHGSNIAPWPGTTLLLKVLATGTLTRLGRASSAPIGGGSTSQDALFAPDGSSVLYALALDHGPGNAGDIRNYVIENLATGALTRLATAPGGAPANGGSEPNLGRPAFSLDGRRVLFHSAASNLVTGDTNGAVDLFLRDLTTGAITRVNTAADGTQADADVGSPDSGSYYNGYLPTPTYAFLPDGNSVLFVSRASNLVPDDSNGDLDIFVKNLATGAVTRVSTAANGAELSHGIYGPAILSSDGTRVLFRSYAPNLGAGDNNRYGLFVRNLVTGTLTRIDMGVSPNGYEPSPYFFSPDGTRVLFHSDAATLVPGDTNGTPDIFVYDIVTGARTRVNTTTEGAQGAGNAEASAFSPDGSSVLFWSFGENPFPGVTVNRFDHFIKTLDLPATVFGIAATDARKPEGTAASPTPFTFTVTRAGNLAAEAQVTWTAAGTAHPGTVPAAPSDFYAADFAANTFPTGTITFAPGEASRRITLDIAADARAELNEAFAVTLSAPSPGTAIGSTTLAAAATAIIYNDDTAAPAALAIARTSSNTAEGTGGATHRTFTVTRTGTLAATHTATWTVAGTILPNTVPASATDFPGATFPTGTITFAPGEATQTITVPIAADATGEFNEAFRATLSNPSAGAGFTTRSASAVILNDDTSFAIAAADSWLMEQDTGEPTARAVFTVTRTGDTTGTDTIDFAVAGTGPNSADAIDFAGDILPAGTLTFAPGETRKSVPVTIAGDNTVELDEDFAITLANPSPGAAITTASAARTILSDDSLISIAAAHGPVAEGTGSATPYTFTITRAGSTWGNIDVRWRLTGATGPGTVAAGLEDFAVTPGVLHLDTGGPWLVPTPAIFGTVTLAHRQGAATLTVEIAADHAYELNERFAVSLTYSSKPIGTAIAQGIIVDGDTIRSTAAGETLAGQSTRDLFLLGGGIDTVYGYGEPDFFRFLPAALGPAATSATTLVDFSRPGGERIDLTAIDAIDGAGLADDIFTFIGTAPFDGTPGQLRWQDLTDGTLLVQGNTNTDAAADLTIFLRGPGPIDATWFAL